MNGRSINWQGNITAIVTPFTKDGKIDKNAFIENIELLIGDGIDGVIVTGCTGELWALNSEERTFVHQLAVDTVAGRVPVICGTIHMEMNETIKLSKQAKKMGADGIMITPVPYVRPNEEEIFAYYRKISDETDIPILVYNIPKRVGVEVSPQLLAGLTEIDNVVAVKQSGESLEEVMETVRLCGDKMKIFAGHSVTRGFPCAVVGVDGFVSSVETQIIGKEAIDLYKISLSGNLEEAKKTQYRLFELDHAVHGLGTFPAALKAAMNLRGRPGGYPRPPVMPLADDAIAQLKVVLKKLDLL